MTHFNVTRERAAERIRRANAGQHQRAILHQRISDAWLHRSDDAAALASMHANLTELLRVQTDIDMSRHRTNAVSTFSPLVNDTAARATTTRATDDRPCIIYCDPPWSYGNQSHSSAAELHYRTMTDAELAALPVAGLAGEDCALLMWATLPKLESALRVMAAWGFEYRTVFVVWVKVQRYMGRLRSSTGTYTQPNAELVLLGTRGRISAAASTNAELINNVVLSRKREHSRKPDILRRMAVEVFGDYPRVELFARGHVSHDWLAWGNEVTSGSSATAATSDGKKKRKRRTVVGATYSVLEHYGAHNCITTSSTVVPEGSGIAGSGDRSVAALDDQQLDGGLYTLDQFNSSVQSHRVHAMGAGGAGCETACDSDVGASCGICAGKRETGHHHDDGADERLDGGVTMLDQFYSSTATGGRHPLYPLLTEVEVQQNADIITARQRRNADELFVYNYAKDATKHQVEWPRRPALE
jgi:N6-adenosine-specific RNA methylase IME4